MFALSQKFALGFFISRCKNKKIIHLPLFLCECRCFRVFFGIMEKEVHKNANRSLGKLYHHYFYTLNLFYYSLACFTLTKRRHLSWKCEKQKSIRNKPSQLNFKVEGQRRNSYQQVYTSRHQRACHKTSIKWNTCKASFTAFSHTYYSIYFNLNSMRRICFTKSIIERQIGIFIELFVADTKTN